jgi:hypothetical protein
MNLLLYYGISFFFLCFLWGGMLSAQSATEPPLPDLQETLQASLTLETGAHCSEEFTINGPETTYLGETLNYSLPLSIDQGMSFPVSYTLNLKDGNKILQKSQESALQISFGQEGAQNLVANITQGDCEYQIEKTITTYKNSVVYIGGKEDAFQLNYDQNFAENGTYFAKIVIDATTTEEDLKTLLRKEIRNLSHADTIIIKYADFDQVLHAYIELMDQGLIEKEEEKNIFIVSTTNQSFINRVLSLFIQDL